MATDGMTSLFAGSDDEALLYALHRRIQSPRNDAERTFRRVWDAVDLLHSETDGIEMLVVDGEPLEDYAAAFDKIGMSQVAAILSRVLGLISADLRQPQNKQALVGFLARHRELFTRFTCDFCAACLAFVPIAARYVREHRDDFCEDA